MAKKKAATNQRQLSDGQISFRLPSGTSVSVDILEAKLAFEQVEDKYTTENKETGDREVRPTPQFLRELAAACEGLGFTGCTPTMAYQLWEDISAAWVGLKKSTG